MPKWRKGTGINFFLLAKLTHEKTAQVQFQHKSKVKKRPPDGNPGALAPRGERSKGTGQFHDPATFQSASAGKSAESCDEDTGRNCGTDNSGNIRTHSIHQQEVGRIKLLTNLV